MKKTLIQLMACFILSREKRRKFRQTLIGEIDQKTIEKYLKYQKENWEIEFVNKEKNSQYKILHYSTYKSKCGISTFLDDLLVALKNNGVNYNAVFPVKFEYLQDVELIYSYLDKIINTSAFFDLVLIQHEYAFWSLRNIFHNAFLFNKLNPLYSKYNHNKLSYSLLLLDYFVERILLKKKKITIIWHTDFELSIKQLFLLNGNIENYKKIPFFRFFDCSDLKIVVMNSKMKNGLEKYKIPTNNIRFCMHPVKTSVIEKCCIKENKNEVILGGFGFIDYKKGIHIVLKSLLHLPKNYKYIHIGGVHPRKDDKYLIELKTFIKENGLSERVQFTGFLDFEAVEKHIKNIDIGIYLALSENNYASGAINQLILNGVPVITSSNASFKDIKNAYDCIEIFEDYRDEKKLADKIQTFYLDKKRLQKIKDNCKYFCIENTFEKFADSIIEEQFLTKNKGMDYEKLSSSC